MGLLAMCGYGRTGSPGACLPAWLNPQRWGCRGLTGTCCCGGGDAGYGKASGEDPGKRDADVEKGFNNNDGGKTKYQQVKHIRIESVYSTCHLRTLSPTSRAGDRVHPVAHGYGRDGQSVRRTGQFTC